MYGIVGEENCYWGGDETVGFAVVGGELIKVYNSKDVIG